MRWFRHLCLTGAVAFTAVAAEAATVLYDPTLSNNQPGQQGWNYGAFPLDFQATTGVSGGRLQLNSINQLNDYAGYFTYDPLAPAVPTLPLSLDRNTGFTLSFNAAVAAESHASANRGGFSFLFVTSDNTKALELAFQADRVFNYDAGFLPEHTVLRDTSPATQYDISVSGDTWQLSANNAPILSGALVDYTGFAGIPIPLLGTIDPYEQANTIFFGDDTTSAGVDVNLGAITLTPVPEPATLLLLGIAAVFYLSRRRLK